jgi:hypothetical protein
MPRFYFDVVAGGELYPDGEGLDLGTLTEAREHALRLIARMLREAPVAWDWRRWAVTVAGCDGTALLHVHFPSWNGSERRENDRQADSNAPAHREQSCVLATPRVATRKAAVL